MEKLLNGFKEMELMDKINYVGLGLALAGQIFIADYYLIGTYIFLLANLVGVFTSFKENLPVAHRIKNVAFLVVTVINVVKVYIA